MLSLSIYTLNLICLAPPPGLFTAAARVYKMTPPVIEWGSARKCAIFPEMEDYRKRLPLIGDFKGVMRWI